MKRTFLVMAMVIALAMSTMVTALAAGHNNGAVQGTATDDNFGQEVDYLFNKAGYHFWFTATGWASSGYYELGDSYHNIYKYSVDDPWNWCDTTTIPDREPYNAGDTAGQTAYYKIWNVTTETWVCGGENVVVTGQLDSSDDEGITVPIPQDGLYELEVSGTWQNGSWWEVDAVCVEQGSLGANTGDTSELERIWLRTWQNGSFVDPPFGDVLVGDVSPWTQTDADCSDAGHTYSTSVTVTGNSVDLKVYDSVHTDNEGWLDYTLTRIG